MGKLNIIMDTLYVYLLYKMLIEMKLLIKIGTIFQKSKAGFIEPLEKINRSSQDFDKSM